jgi:hypothetical protein
VLVGPTLPLARSGLARTLFTVYRERLNVPLWWWLAAPAAAGLLAAEVYLGAPGYATVLPYTVLVPAVVFVLWWAGRVRIAVTPDELQVDDARLPLRFVGAVAPLSPLQTRDLLGPVAEPYAFVIQRPWVGTAVRVDLTDPADPTPYWVISTRHPGELAAAIDASRVGSGG